MCVAAPFVAVLSAKEGRLELGGYGTLNYAWDVDGVNQVPQLDRAATGSSAGRCIRR